MSRVIKQGAILLALVVCLPMAALAFLASSLIAIVEALVRAADD